VEARPVAGKLGAEPDGGTGSGCDGELGHAAMLGHRRPPHNAPAYSPSRFMKLSSWDTAIGS
jgi:hypothetical protein